MVHEGTSSGDEERTCFVCGNRATKLVIGDDGLWKLCEEASCWQKLTEGNPTERLTWITRPLPEQTDEFD